MIPTPVMNHICKRWNLPTHIKQNCDAFFLRNFNQKELEEQVFNFSKNPDVWMVSQANTLFEVVWMYEAEEVFHSGTFNLEPASYWLSFRSITFCFAGKEETKSYVLVQVDKKKKVLEVTPQGGTNKETLEDRNLKKAMRWYYATNGSFAAHQLDPVGVTKIEAEKLLEEYHVAYPAPKKSWTSFADKSQPIEKDSEKED